MVNHIAIIPARGGSKRIPRKNIVPFCNRPMIGWTISAAIDSGVFDKVIVSTDDEEIAAIARAEGADVPFLRSMHADDQSVVSAAIVHALTQAELHYDVAFSTVTQLMPNCPLRGAAEIQAAWSNFHSGAHHFQISAFEFGWMNPWWAARMRENDQPQWLFPDALAKRSQDLDPLFCPTGAIWIASSDGLRKNGSFYGPGHVLFPIPWQAAIDIDDLSDLKMAEALMQMSTKRNCL